MTEEEANSNVCVCADDGFRYRLICQTIEDDEGYRIKLSECKSNIVRQHKGEKNEKRGKGPPFESWKKNSSKPLISCIERTTVRSRS